MKRRLILLAAILAVATAWPAIALAQNVEHGRGNIVSIDANRGTIDLRDPQGRTATWRFNRGAAVKFTDGRNFFPNPSVQDLRPPMYVHYTFRNEVIDSFDVVELGFEPGNEQSASERKEQGKARTVVGRVTAYDASVRQVEIEHRGERETFQLTDRSDTTLSVGDQVTLRTDWSGQRELVVELRRTGRRDRDDDGRGRSNSGAVGSNTRGTSTVGGVEVAQGRVVRITPRGVVMQVAGTQQNYGVQDPSLLRQLRVGDTVSFEYTQDRNGRMFITNVR
jgi:Cu/Ag efflux protein CusF